MKLSNINKWRANKLNGTLKTSKMAAQPTCFLLQKWWYWPHSVYFKLNFDFDEILNGSLHDFEFWSNDFFVQEINFLIVYCSLVAKLSEIHSFLGEVIYPFFQNPTWHLQPSRFCKKITILATLSIFRVSVCISIRNFMKIRLSAPYKWPFDEIQDGGLHHLKLWMTFWSSDLIQCVILPSYKNWAKFVNSGRRYGYIFLNSIWRSPPSFLWKWLYGYASCILGMLSAYQIW